MSHAAAVRTTTPQRRWLQAVVLVVVFALLYVATRTVPDTTGRLGTIAGVGLLLLAGTLMSEVLEVFHVPHLTGYLAAGILAGPHVLHIIDEGAIKNLGAVQPLALALIAMAGGLELRIDTVRPNLLPIAWSTLTQTLFVFGIVALTFVLARGMIPFVAKGTVMQAAGVALLWGVLAVSRSPSVVLGILSQTRARGPLASYTLAFVMVSDIVVVILLAGAITLARPMLEPNAEISGEAFRKLSHEILGSVAIGTTLGLALIVYLRFVGSQLLLVLVAIGFGFYETLHYLRFEPLLTFMVAGFIVQNLSTEGEKLLTAVSDASAVVFVVFFAHAGAHLDLPLLGALWKVALLLCAMRALATFGAARLAVAMSDQSPKVLRDWSWAGLVSQAGLTLGLSVIVEQTFPAFGADFRSLVLASVGINEVIGPVLFKLALDRAGETKPEQSRLETLDLGPAPPTPH